MSSSVQQRTGPISNDELRSLLLAYRRQNWNGIQVPEWQERIVTQIVADDGAAVLRAIAPFWALPQNARVLDIGSGVGSFVLACRRRGLRAVGVEPDRIGQGAELTSVQIAKRRLDEQVFAVAVGEALPFANSTFDLVVMDQVIEHVRDQEAVLREAARVVKKGGLIYVACPNYLRFYEPHYKIPWLPLLPKTLGRIYLRMRRRDPVLLEQLTYTTNRRVHALLDNLGPEYTVLDVNAETLRRKLREGGFRSWQARFLQKLSHIRGLGKWMEALVLKYFAVREGGTTVLVFRRGER